MLLLEQEGTFRVDSFSDSEYLIDQLLQGQEVHGVPVWTETMSEMVASAEAKALWERYVSWRDSAVAGKKIAVVLGDRALVGHIGLYHSLINGKKAYQAPRDQVVALVRELLNQSIASLTLIGLFDDLDYMIMLEVHQLLLEQQFEVPFGMFAAATEIELGHHVTKSVLAGNKPREKDFMALTMILNETFESRENLSIFTSAHLKYDDYLQVSKDGLRSFNLISHGRDDSIWMSNALVCGRFHDHIPEANSFKLPTCANTNECFRPEQHLLRAKDIDAQVVFLNSCLGFRLGTGNFDQDYVIANSVIRGKAAALIASPFLKDSEVPENILFQYLLEAGMSLGQITNILNKALYHIAYDFPQLFLLGDPDLVLAKQAVSIPTIRWEGIKKLKVDSYNRYCVRIELPDYELTEKIRSQKIDLIITPKNTKHQLYYTVVSDEERTHLYVYSLDQHPVFTLQLKELQNEVEREFANRLEELQALADLNNNIPRLNSIMSEIQSSLRFISKQVRHSYFDVQAANKVRQRRMRIHEMLQKCDLLLLEDLLLTTEKKVFHFGDTYRGSTRIRYRFDHFVQCPYCNRECLEMEAQHRINQKLIRHIVLCPTCGLVGDRPVEPIVFRIESQDQWEREEPSTFSVYVENQGDELYQGYVGARLIDANRHGSVLEPGCVEVHLEPGEKATFAFTLTVGKQATPHQHWISSFMVLNSRIYNTRRNIWVR